MIEQGSQFTCPQCGKPQFTADFGFERHHHEPNEVKDPCVFCGESTAPGGLNRVDPKDPESVANLIKNLPLMNSKFINRLSGDFHVDGKIVEGYACEDCMREPCDKCNKLVGLDYELHNNGIYHPECLPKEHNVDKGTCPTCWPE